MKAEIIKWVSLVGKIASFGVAFDWTTINSKWAIVIYIVSSVIKDLTNRATAIANTIKDDTGKIDVAELKKMT